ncbi:TPA: hypothetical protein KQG29_001418 [Clostridioides difficile]|nr:hypothetical protein [Clostridioides difficile]
MLKHKKNTTEVEPQIENKREWFEVEDNQEALKEIKIRFPVFNREGLEDELSSFIFLYLKYINNDINEIFKCVKCTSNVKNYIEQKKINLNRSIYFDRLTFLSMGISNFICFDDYSIIRIKLFLSSEDNKSVKIYNTKIPITQKHIYEIDYKILTKEYLFICGKCNLTTINKEKCVCGGDIKKYNKKIISDFKVLKEI